MKKPKQRYYRMPAPSLPPKVENQIGHCLATFWMPESQREERFRRLILGGYTKRDANLALDISDGIKLQRPTPQL